jgi:hypothetical protein
LHVFDALGRRVATLAEGFAPAGTHHYAWDGSGLSSGTYFYRLQAGTKTFTQRMLLVR